MFPVRFIDALLETTALLRADQERALAAHGLNASRAQVLWIVHHGGPAKQADLAVVMGVTPRHVTTLVDGLAGQGLARRVPHPNDRRAVLVELTERGSSLAQRMAEDHERLDDELLSALPPADAVVVARAMPVLLERIRRLSDEAERS